MKKRSFVIIILFLTITGFLLTDGQANASTTERLYRTNCRVNPAAEHNVFVDENGDRIYYNLDQKVLWDIANDFCISLDLLVAYNFILVPREPVQYTYIKLPPGPEKLGWFPGRSLRRSIGRENYSSSLLWSPDDPLGPENLARKQAALVATSPTQVDPFFSSGTSQQFIWPISLNQGAVSQLYHRNHHGVDIAVPIGTPVDSMANGWVIRVEQDHHVFGKLIVIDHGNDLMGVYGHLNQTNVKEGDFVWQGDLIALSGNTGRSSAPHLHIEIRHTFRYVDPCTYLMNCPEQAFHGPRPVTADPTPPVLQNNTGGAASSEQGSSQGASNTGNQDSTSTGMMPEPTAHNPQTSNPQPASGNPPPTSPPPAPQNPLPTSPPPAPQSTPVTMPTSAPAYPATSTPSP